MAKSDVGVAEIRRVTCSAPVNIAVIKYWGKRNEQLILPLNSSLSVTLHQNELRAKTTIALSTRFNEDKLWINGKQESIDNPRVQRCLTQIRQIAQTSSKIINQDIITKGCVHICSENNFPTAAGLASSAAGYACLVYCLAQVYGLENVELSKIARQGSGSACRSIYGGFVAWEKGVREDGEDSLAIQVAPDSHWPNMEVLILVVSDQKKAVSSTTGMQTSVETSSLIQYRANEVVPQRMVAIKEAILKKDFDKFGQLTMQDSNQFHAICLDTYPPISYLNDTSKYIIQLVTQYNNVYGLIKGAYSFDAGPNAVIFAMTENIPELLSVVRYYLPQPSGEERKYCRGLSDGLNLTPPPKDIIDAISLSPWEPGALQYIIHTKVGPDPQVIGNLESGNHLLNEQGLPH